MKVTVCELPEPPDRFEEAWEALAGHVAAEQSRLVLLPEMPFAPWFPAHPDPDARVWAEAVAAHSGALNLLGGLAPATVVATRPVERDGRRFNEGFVWEPGAGMRSVHTKTYLPDEEGYREATWYEAGEGRFEPFEAAGAKVGMMICTDLWFFQHARAFGQSGVQFLLVPRATPRATLQKWVAGGRTAAVVCGAWCLSSNRTGSSDDPVMPGGGGWIIDPDGEVIAVTGPMQPFLTRDLDPGRSDAAKAEYPRYVKEPGSGGSA